MSLFASNSKNKTYHFVNEFLGIQEIKEANNEIRDNLEKVEFKTSQKNFGKKIVLINVKMDSKIKTIKSKDVTVPPEMLIINNQQNICTLKPSNVNIKILLKIEV